MRPPGPARCAVLAALRNMRRRKVNAADYEEVARLAKVPVEQARTTLKNLRREDKVHVCGEEVRRGTPRARALFALGPAANDGGSARLECAMRAWA